MSTSTRKLVTGQSGIRHVTGYTTDDQTSTRKLVRDSESFFEKSHNEEKMKEINKKLLYWNRMRGNCECSNNIGAQDPLNGQVYFGEV